MKQHHTLTQILNGLLLCGFALEAVEEAHPSEEMLALPEMKDEMRRPMMLLVKARKPEDFSRSAGDTVSGKGAAKKIRKENEAMVEEKDYYMRVVHELVRTLIRLVFRKDIDKDEEKTVPLEVLEQYKRLTDMIDEGQINEA